MAMKYRFECFPVKLSLKASEDAHDHFFNPKYRISSREVETLLNFRSKFSADLLQEYASREDSYTLCIDFDKFSLVYLRIDRKKLLCENEVRKKNLCKHRRALRSFTD